jgi:acid phosphatase
MMTASAIRAAPLPPIHTIFIMVFENKDWSEIIGNTNAPYINSLLPMASYCQQYYTPPGNHPSEPNYLWLEAGTNFGIFDDNPPAINSQNTTNHFVTLLQNAGISWKTYQEGIPGTPLALSLIDTNYDPKHDPFVFFDDVTGTNDPYNAYGITHVRPFSELAGDLASNTAARYNFITPTLCNDSHDCSITQSDLWLSQNLPLILASQAYSNNGAIFITWDEGDGDNDGPLGMIVLSPLGRGGGYRNNIHYDHASTLRTFQEIFHVYPLLNAAADATDLSDLFGGNQIISDFGATSSGFQFTVNGLFSGQSYVIETSPDLTTWSPVATNVCVNNSLHFADLAPASFPQRFYRFITAP